MTRRKPAKNRSNRGRADTAVRSKPKPAQPPAKPRNWWQRQSGGVITLVVLGAIAALVGGHYLLWGAVFPAVGEVVGRVPVVSTVTGWLFGGGAFVAWGVFAINLHTARPGTLTGLRVVAWSWTAVAALCLPTGYANGTRLPVDFWAGVYASTYGVILTPVALGVVALGWWLVADKLLGHKKGPGSQAVGWICVGYATLLLVWGSTLLRA